MRESAWVLFVLVVYVLWLRNVLAHFVCCFVQMCVVGMDEGCGSLGSVPDTAVICVTSEGGDLIGTSVLRDSWEYNGVAVHVSTERWWLAILHTVLDMLVRKHLSGSDVGLAGYKKKAVLALYGWLEISVANTMFFGSMSMWTRMACRSGGW